MVLQYRLPFDVPEHGARAGDTVVIDLVNATIEVGRELPSAALTDFGLLIPRLLPVHAPLLPEAASAAVVALAPARSRLRIA